MSESLLKDRNIRATPFRLAVLDVFKQYKNAIGLTTIEEEVGSHDRITLYRTLKTFTEQGIIHEIVLPGGEKRMALCAHDCEHDGHEHQHEHIHFQCKKCNEIFCVEVDKFPKLKLKNFSIDSVEITAKGLCKKCK
ncbi:MAG: Fur family transcriptional regulator [Bacteroidia bacterium]